MKQHECEYCKKRETDEERELDFGSFLAGFTALSNGAVDCDYDNPFVDAIPTGLENGMFSDYERLFVREYLRVWMYTGGEDATFERCVNACTPPDYMSKDVFRDCMAASEYAHVYYEQALKRMQEWAKSKDDEVDTVGE